MRRALHPLTRPLRRLVLGIAVALAAAPALAPAQVRLPSLGESASEEFTLGAEKRLGEQVMRDIRRDPDYLDDAPLLAYLQSLWQPLVAAARQRGDIGADVERLFPWEAFLVRDRSVNAFALPGGYVGVHLGLIAMTASRDELASVLAHELSHVTQRHIARSIAAQSRASTLGMAAMLLGVIAASRANNPDMAQAAVVGGQAAMIQSQLNFSRDMEREADRNGFALMLGAGFGAGGMASMFEKLDQANRLNDNGSYPYLRSHPLTSERIGDARSRAAAAGSTGPATAPGAEHALMQARARVLMDPAVLALRRLQASESRQGASFAERLGQVYAAALASSRLREFDRAEAAWRQGRDWLAAGPRADAAAERAFAMLGTELALAAGDAALAQRRIAPLEADASREVLLLRAQVALASGASQALRDSAQSLQAWTAEHPADAPAWALLAQGADRLGLKLRSVRAEAESHAAIGDLQGAIERLRAGQRLARENPGAAADFIELSVIDARLRDLSGQRRQLLAESRGKGGGPRQGEPE